MGIFSILWDASYVSDEEQIKKWRYQNFQTHFSQNLCNGSIEVTKFDIAV